MAHPDLRPLRQPLCPCGRERDELRLYRRRCCAMVETLCCERLGSQALLRYVARDEEQDYTRRRPTPVAPVAATSGNLTRSRIFYVQNLCNFRRFLLILSQHNAKVTMYHHRQDLSLMDEDPFHDF